MIISTFSRKGKENRGYNEIEVAKKIDAVNEAHGVYQIRSKWKPARKVRDPRGGWMVEISTR